MPRYFCTYFVYAREKCAHFVRMLDIDNVKVNFRLLILSFSVSSNFRRIEKDYCKIRIISIANVISRMETK